MKTVFRFGIAVSVLFLCVFSVAAANQRVPAVTVIYPPYGSVEGGTVVTIHGTYFQGVPSVVIGGVPLTNVVRKSAGEITGTTGARMRGTVTLVVTNPDGANARLLKGFTYTDGACCEYPRFTTTALTGASQQPPPSVAVGTFTGLWNSPVFPAFDFISLFVGDASPDFTPVRKFDSNANFSATEVLDMNGDSIEDVAMAALGGDVLTLLGDRTDPFSDSRIAPSTAVAFALDSGDSTGMASPISSSPTMNPATSTSASAISAVADAPRRSPTPSAWRRPASRPVTLTTTRISISP